jgi:hypothetical protein
VSAKTTRKAEDRVDRSLILVVPAAHWRRGDVGQGGRYSLALPFPPQLIEIGLFDTVLVLNAKLVAPFV